MKKLLEERGELDGYEITAAGIQGSADTPPTEHPRIGDYTEAWKDLKRPTEAHGIDINDNVSTPITRELMEAADIVFSMDRKVL